MKDVREGLSFDDVLLVPKKGIVDSRKHVDLSTWLTRDVKIGLPIISAPMTSVTGHKMATAMSKAGGFGIIHRFMSVPDHLNEFAAASYEGGKIGSALGIDEGYERLERLYDIGCRIFCIDVAHAHCAKMEQFFERIDPELKSNSQFIVGNVGTRQGALFLKEIGADAVKVGIGPGAACQTREVTGFGVPQLSAIYDIMSEIRWYSIPIIADGGCKNSGDIVKALAAGANTVMLGRLLAGADEAPLSGEYFGMASRRVNGHNAPEGAEGVIEKTGPVLNTLKSLAWGIRSGISYGGGEDIKGLQTHAEWIRVDHGTRIESAVRI